MKQIYFLNLCECGCREIVYGNKRFSYGHQNIGRSLPKRLDTSRWLKINNPMKRPEVVKKFIGTNNPSKRPEVREKLSKSSIGRTRSEAAKIKQSVSRIGIFVGERAGNWQGGKSFEPYCPKFNFKIKEEIREKYCRKCLLCKKTEEENGCRLHVHHVDYDKEQGCNGKKFELIPLCNSCHSKTGSKKRREEYKNKILSILYSQICSESNL